MYVVNEMNGHSWWWHSMYVWLLTLNLTWWYYYYCVHRKFQKELTFKPSCWPWLDRGLYRTCLSKVWWSYLAIALLYRMILPTSWQLWWWFINRVTWLMLYNNNMMDDDDVNQASTSEGTTALRLPSRMDHSKLLWSKYYYHNYYYYYNYYC